VSNSFDGHRAVHALVIPMSISVCRESTGIVIWLWIRSSILAAISSAAHTSNVASLGMPSATYTRSSCSVGKFFQPQQTLLDIKLCDPCAGEMSIYETRAIAGGTNMTSRSSRT